MAAGIEQPFYGRAGWNGTDALLAYCISFPVIFIATWKTTYKNAGSFYALMLLSQAGLMGVFLAMDALLFYFFWELALIPVYFLCSQWGGEKRIQVTFKFFIYTFVGSLLMLVGIIYLYLHTPDHSFSHQIILCNAVNHFLAAAILVVLVILYCLCNQDADISISYLAA